MKKTQNMAWTAHLLFDDVFHFTSLNRSAAHCRLRLFKTGDEDITHIALLTESGSNTGQSITDAIEIVCTEAANEFMLNPTSVIWVEYHNAKSKRQFEYVTFSAVNDLGGVVVLSRPSWRQTNQSEIEFLVGPLNY